MLQCNINLPGALNFPRLPGLPLEHDPEKPAPDLIRVGNRFSEKIMLKQKPRA
jgi:hypothetical protein